MSYRFHPYILLILLFLFSQSAIAWAQEEPLQTTGTLPAEVEATVDAKPDIVSVLTNGKSTEVEIEEAAIEKKEIEIEKQQLKKELINSNSETKSLRDEGKKDVLLERLETVREREEVVTIKQDLAKKKKQTSEKITGIIEQKLQFMQDESINFAEIGTEILLSQRTLRKLKGEQGQLENQIVNIQQELKLLHQDIAAKTTLSELKVDDEYIRQSIAIQKERLSLLESKIIQVNKKIELVVIEKNILTDYVIALENSRSVRFHKEMLTRKPFFFTEEIKLKMCGILIVLIFLTYVILFKSGKNFSNFYVAGFSIQKFILTLLFLGWGGYFVYYILSFVGYHNLSNYAGRRILLSIGAIYAFQFAYRLFYLGLKWFFTKNLDEKESQLQYESPLFALINGLVWMIFAAVTLYGILHIWELKYDQWQIVRGAAQFSVIKVGNIELSLLLILKIGFIIWGLILFSHILNKFLDKRVYPKTRLDESARYTISTFIKYALIFLGLITGLNIIGFKLSTLNVLAGTVGIGIGIGLQEIAKNFISGLILLVERPVKVGDYIDLDGLPGRVSAIKARGTVINTYDNISVVVPNSDFITKQVVNWSYNDRVIRLCVPVGVAYGSDVDLVQKSLLAVAEQHNKVLKKPAPNVYFTEFGADALVFKLYVWTNDQQYRFKLASDLHFMIDKLFRDRKICIAFPQRDLHLKTSDVVFQLKTSDDAPADDPSTPGADFKI